MHRPGRRAKNVLPWESVRSSPEQDACLKSEQTPTAGVNNAGVDKELMDREILRWAASLDAGKTRQIKAINNLLTHRFEDHMSVDDMKICRRALDLLEAM